MRTFTLLLFVSVFSLLILSACRSEEETAESPMSTTNADTVIAVEPAVFEQEASEIETDNINADSAISPEEAGTDSEVMETQLLPSEIAPILKPWKGDLDGMVERRFIRVLTVQNPILYFLDKGRELGLTFEMMKAFERSLNKSLKRRHLKIHVLMIPVSREELIPRLVAGYGDIAAATLTITPERLQQVDFSKPFGKNVSEVVVTAPGSPELTGIDDLSGREVHVRLSSSYAEHLNVLNQRFLAENKAPVKIVVADENLEDSDLLEMVAAGLIPAIVVDDFEARLWAQVFPKLQVNVDAAINTGGEIGLALRKNSPQLKKVLDSFADKHKQGTLMGNILINRYLKSTKWVRNALSDKDIARLRPKIKLFQKYASQYDLDWLFMAAQAYQESGLDQSKVSHTGAVGIMQVLPSTARDRAINIPDIHQLESNIHAGIKYDRWLIDNFLTDSEIQTLDKMLLTLASYNAGPGRVIRLRKQAKQQGLNPNRWFDNVEIIAAKRIGRETVQYVSNIYKYYLVYQMMVQRRELHERLLNAEG